MCGKALEVFQLLDAKGLCNELSAFYENWAFEMENSGNLKKADIIYQRGLLEAKDSTLLLKEAHKSVTL